MYAQHHYVRSAPICTISTIVYGQHHYARSAPLCTISTIMYDQHHYVRSAPLCTIYYTNLTKSENKGGNCTYLLLIQTYDDMTQVRRVVPFEKPVFVHLAKNFSQLVETKVLLLSCQEPANGSYPEQYEPLMLSPSLCLAFERSLFPLHLTT